MIGFTNQRIKAIWLSSILVTAPYTENISDCFQWTEFNIGSLFATIASGPGNEAQRAIDEEIVALIAEREAAIRALKYRRNSYSNISRLPPEIILEICRFAKTGDTQDVKRYQTMNAVGGVCRQWRELLLATPDMWGVINLNARDRAVELLELSKSSPLQIRYQGLLSLPQCLADEEAAKSDELLAKAVGSKARRIQEIYMETLSAIELMRLIRLYFGAGTLMLESLRLATVVAASLSSDILRRDMPSLFRLDLGAIMVLNPLPPLPRLSYLKLSAPSTVLLPSLQNTPNLKELDVFGYNGQYTYSGSRVPLPKLSHAIITSDKLDGAIILANMEYPSSTRIFFSNSTRPRGDNDLSYLVEVCRRFAKPGAPEVNVAIMNSWELGRYFQMYLWTQGTKGSEPPNFHLELKLNYRNGQYLASCLQLCSPLPLKNFSYLNVGGWHELTVAGWQTLFGHFQAARDLHLQSVHTEGFCALLKAPHLKRPRILPNLRRVHVLECELSPTLQVTSFDTFEDLLKERKRSKMPIEYVIVDACNISKNEAEELRRFTYIQWIRLRA